MKNIVILGSTGSIGENTLRVVEALPDRFRVRGLAVQSNVEGVLEQAARFGVGDIAVSDPAAAARCATRLPPGLRLHGGEEGPAVLADMDDVDVVVCAVVGMAGLQPVMAAVSRGTDVALATKEVLVGAGRLVTDRCRATGARLLPVDSEHSAVFQCLGGTWDAQGRVRRIILTASGGPFHGRKDVDFDDVSVEDALRHPTWTMGRKVTVDSATLMNKGLELIEAHWLFGMPMSALDVLIHPQSIVHALVEFADGNTVAHMGPADMRFAIQYALAYPERVEGGLPVLDLVEAGPLEFSAPDPGRFPCLDLARQAGEQGGSMPVVLNAANEAAVAQFLADAIPFSGIWRLVAEAMQAHTWIENPGLEAILETDGWAREFVDRHV